MSTLLVKIPEFMSLEIVVLIVNGNKHAFQEDNKSVAIESTVNYSNTACNQHF